MIVQKGGQVTKPIIVVKVPCKLLYVIQVKEFLIKCSTSWPYLISEFLSLGHLIKDDSTKRWPSDKANHSCESAL